MSPRSGIPFAPTRVLGLLTATAALTLVAAPAVQAAGPATPRAAKHGPKLQVAVTGVPKHVRRGERYVAKVRVTNRGRATARKVQLRIGRAKGVTVRSHRTRRWSALKPRKHRQITLRVTVGKQAKRTSKLRLRATAADRVRAHKTVVLRAVGPLVGRYFWGFQTHTDWAWDTRGLYVVSDRWAYRGLPEGGLPDCTGTTATLDEDGKPTGDGCFPFRYDAKTGAITVGPYQGSYVDGKLTLEDIAMSELAVPEEGARYQVALEHRGFRGLCGLILGCSTWHYSLVLNDQGQFVDSHSSLSTFGGVGTPFIAAGNYPPDEYGTYKILSGGRILLAYANGTAKVRTIGVELDQAGKPDAAGTGLLLDDTNYYPPSD